MSLRYRPLAVIGFTVLAVLCFSASFSKLFAVIALCLGAFLFLLTLLIPKLRNQIFPFYISAALVISSVLFISVYRYDLPDAGRFVGREAQLEGVVLDEPEFKNSRYYYLVGVKSIDGEKVKIKTRLSLPNCIYAEPYDTVKLRVTFYELGIEDSDVKLYYNSKGVFLGAYAYNDDDFSVEVTENENKPVAYHFLKLRNEIESRILQKLPNEYGGTVTAMLLGDKKFISDELNESFCHAGIAPVFAVSGLHLTVWVFGLYAILDKLNFRKRFTSAVCIAFTLFFMALTGFSVSVCRSGIMQLVLLTGNLFYRKSDSLNSLGLAALILCLVNPFTAVDTGFLLSFFATFGIITLYPIADRGLISFLPDNMFGKLMKPVLGAVFVSLSATAATFPITVIKFGYISIFTVFTNLLVTYPATLCMVFGGFSAILFKIDVISDFFALLSGLISKYILWVVDLVSSADNAVVGTDNVFWQSAAILCFAVLIFALIFLKKLNFVKVTCIGMSAVTLVCSISSYFYYNSFTQVKVLDLENGSCVVVSKEGEKAVLGCVGSAYNTKWNIIGELDSINKKSAKLLLVPEADDVDSSDALFLIRDYDFDRVVLPCARQSVGSILQSEKTVSADSLSVGLWDGCGFEYRSSDEASFAYLTFDGQTMMIIFSADKKADFDEDFKSADYLVCSGFIPYSLDPSAFGAVIVTSCGKLAEGVSEYVIKSGANLLTGDIRIAVRNGKAKIYLQEA